MDPVIANADLYWTDRLYSVGKRFIKMLSLMTSPKSKWGSYKGFINSIQALPW